MKFFIGIIFWSIFLICSVCIDENEINNGKRMDCYNGIFFIVWVIVIGFENVFGFEKFFICVFVIDEYFKIEFVDGDFIGIFFIKDSIIVDDINNILLVYNVLNDSWNLVENSKIFYWYDGVSYIVYYLYRKNIILDVLKDIDEVIVLLIRNEKL